MTFRRKSLFGTAVFGVVYLALVYYLGDAPELTGGGRLWKGYYTLVVPARHEEESVLRLLEAAGFSGVLSESRTIVRVTAFSQVERVPLSELTARLEAEDPRYDPYMLRLPGFFRAEGVRDRYRLYYVPAEGGTLATLLRLRRAFPNQIDDWFLADFSGVHRWVALAGLLALSIVLVSSARGRRVAMAALCVPWLAGSLSVGGDWVAYAGAVILGSFLILRSEKQPKSLAGAAGLGAILLSSVLILHMKAIPGPSVFAALGATLSVVIISRLWGRRRHVGRDHPLFSPLPILPGPRVEEGSSLRQVLILLPGLFLLGGSLALLPVGRDVPVPTPVRMASADGSAGPDSAPEALPELWVASRGDELPNLSDYLAHVAYQEGFAYGAEFSFPDASEPLTLIVIREEEGRLIERTRIAAVYDEEWMRETLRSVPEGSIERLLLQQPNSTGVVRTPLSGLYSESSHLITYSAVLLVAYSPILIGLLILRLRGARARGSRSTLGRLNHGLAPYLPERGNSSI
jgi:hypothetical protein